MKASLSRHPQSYVERLNSSERGPKGGDAPPLLPETAPMEGSALCEGGDSTDTATVN